MNLKEEQPSQAKLGLRLKDSVEYLIFVPCLVDVVCYAYGTVVVYVSGLGKYVTRALVCLLSPVFYSCAFYSCVHVNCCICRIPIHIIIWLKRVMLRQCSMNITMISITFPTELSVRAYFGERMPSKGSVKVKIERLGKTDFYSQIFLYVYSYRYTLKHVEIFSRHFHRQDFKK